MSDTKLAKIEDIKRLAAKIEDNWSLCQLFEGTSRASEAEYMVARTVHACALNEKEHGEAFSWVGDNVRSSQGNGIVDNTTAYDMLLREEYLIEEKRDGKPILRMSQKLVNFLDEFFANQTE